MYIIIMAGGRGTRFWPLSTEHTPKQLLSLVGNSSLLQQTVTHIAPLVSLQNVYVVTGELLEPKIRQQLPDLPPENVIVEPIGRNTLPCIGLAALYLRKQKEDAVMVVLPADHVIQDCEQFRRLLRAAENLAASDNALITFGIPPTQAETGYGYIHLGDSLHTQDGLHAFEVYAFVEKPDRETAERYLHSGNYLWNSGMFVWRVDVILNAIQTFQPPLYRKLMEIAPSIGTEREFEAIHDAYSQMGNVSVDYGVMEKARNVLVIPTNIGWSDVGSWAAIRELFDRDASGNAVRGKHLGIDTQNCVIYNQATLNPDFIGNKMIATIGVSDLIIVESEHAVLVCSVERAQEVKNLVETLEKEPDSS